LGSALGGGAVTGGAAWIVGAIASAVALRSVWANASESPPARRRVVYLAVCALLCGAAWCRAERARSAGMNWSGTEVSGRIQHRLRGNSGDLLRVTGLRERVELPSGIVRPNDRITIAADAKVVRHARGPLSLAEPTVAAVLPLADEVVRHKSPTSAWLRLKAYGAERLARVRRALCARLPTAADAQLRGLLPALLLGDRSSLPPETIDLFTRTGTRHLLALSGLHVGLVALLIAQPLARLLGSIMTRWRGPTTLLARPPLWILLCFLLWLPLTGMRAPVVRASMCLALACSATWLPARGPGGEQRGRRIDLASLWAFALLVECLRHPLAPTRLDVQLSYTATLGLLLCFRRLG